MDQWKEPKRTSMFFSIVHLILEEEVPDCITLVFYEVEEDRIITRNISDYTTLNQFSNRYAANYELVGIL